MPFLSEDTPLAGGLTPQLPTDVPTPKPDFMRETLPAAFDLFNTVKSATNAVRFGPRGQVDPAYDPFQAIQGYEDHADAFIGADGPEEVARIKRKIDRELQARETLSAAGWEGFAAGLAAGLLDPVNLIPVGGSVYKAGRLGYSVAKSAAAGARAGLVTGAAQEALLYGLQETRTAGESIADVGVTTLLSGALGAAAPLVRAGIGSLREGAAIGRDRRALGELYRRAHADPEGVRIGGADDRHVIDLGQVQQGLERVVVDRGEGAFRANGELKLDTNYGLVKVIWKHGVESPEAGNPQLAHLVVGKADVLDLAAVVRRFEPEHISEPGKGRVEWRWAVEREGENGVRRQVVYAVRRFTHGDQDDHVVTIYAPKPGHELPYSMPRGKVGAGAGSPSEGLRPVGDTAGEPSSQLSQGQRAAPTDMIAPEGMRTEHSPWDDLAARAESDLTVPPEGRDPLEPGFVKVGEGEPPNPAASNAGGSVGARAVRDTTLAEETLKSALGLEKAVGFQDPVLRAVTSPSVEARRTIQELAETPLYFAKNEAGRVASPIAVTTRIKGWDGPLARAVAGLDDLFVRYRVGRERRLGDIQRIAVGDLFGREAGVLDYLGFRKAVGEAMRRGDQSRIPEVAEAAQLMRREVFDPLKDKAIEAGLLPADVKPDTAASYLTRVYDTPRIVARRPEFEGRLVTWLRDLREKSGERLREFEAAKGQHEADLSRLDTEHANVEGEYRTVEAEWQEARRGVVAAERDLVAARREARQAEREFATATDRLERFRPTPDLEKGDPLTQVLKDLRRGGPKPPHSLSEWLRRHGGLRDEGGDVQALGLGDARLVNSKSGMGIEDAARRAQEAGYFSGRGGEPLSAEEFLWAVREDAGGAARMYRDEDLDAVAYLDYLGEFRRQLDELGLDLGMPNARIKAALDAAMAGGEGRFREASPAAKAKAREIEFYHRRAMERHTTAKERLAAAEAKVAEVRAQRDTARLDTYANSAKLAHLEGELRKARAALDKAAKSFESEKAFAGLEDIELADVATQITDQLVGASPARSFYEPVPLTRGPLKERTLTISDYAIEDFLEADAEVVARIYTRTMAADVELATAFGRADMADRLDKIRSEYARLRLGVTDERELAKLDNRMRADLRDVAAVRDRIRGTYALPADPSGMIVRVARVVRNWNYLRMMGGMTLASIADAGRAVMVHGVQRVVGEGLVPLVTNFQGFRLAAKEAQLAGTALDMVLDSRAMQLSEIWDDYGRLSKFERGLHSLTNRFGLVSLMAPWNTAMKQFAAVVTQSRLLQVAEGIAARARDLDPKEAEYLAMLGIDAPMAERIAAQFGRHGERQAGGVMWANTQAWTDREAVDTFRAALVKDVDRIIATPGQDRPLWMSTELGKMIGQFKAFSFASTQRVALASLQQRDAAALNGTLLSLGLGMLSYAAYSGAAGRPMSDDPAVWVKEAFDRSGLLFWLSDVNSIGGKILGVGGTSRYASRSAVEALLGPSLGTGLDTGGRVLSAIGHDEWSASDTRALRRLVPYQNLFYLRRLFDAAEEGANEALGIPGGKG